MYSENALCGSSVEKIEINLIEQGISSLLWCTIPYIHNEYVNIDKRMFEILLLRVLFSSDYLEIKKSAKEWGFL